VKGLHAALEEGGSVGYNIAGNVGVEDGFVQRALKTIASVFGRVYVNQNALIGMRYTQRGG
jgi:hypothetical protein